MFRIVIALVAGCALAAGCDRQAEVHTGGDWISVPLGTISVYQLAGRLDLSVQRSTANRAGLGDGTNTVVIFPDPNGQAYVNGRGVGESGGVRPVGDMLFVPEAMERDIRAALRPRVPRDAEPPVAVPRDGALGRVVIDAGHGGRDPGAISVFRGQEKDVNLAVALAAAQHVSEAGADVTLTRDADRFVELNDRADLANRLEADLFVSIHADSAPNGSATGFTVYVSRSASARTLAAARQIRRALAEVVRRDRGVRRADYRVLVRTSCPAVLVELGYLSNPAEARRLADADYQRKLAAAIARAILEYLGRE